MDNLVEKKDTIEKKIQIPEEIPILPVKDLVLYPNIIIPLVVNDKNHIDMIDEVLSGDKLFGHFTISDKPKNGAKPDAEPKQPDIFDTGTLAEILKMLKFPDGSVRLLVQGTRKIKLLQVTQREPFMKAKVKVIDEHVKKTPEIDAMARNLASTFIKMIKFIPYYPEELQVAVMNIADPVKLVYLIASNINVPLIEKQKLLETNDLSERLKRLLMLINKEIEIIEIGNKIQSQMQSELSKAQREHILREQLKIIQKELGETDERTAEINELRDKIKKAKMPVDVEKTAEQELDRLWKMHPSSAEYTVSRTYIDWLVALPWAVFTEDNLDIAQARKILNEDHYDLEKVKERILEYLAVRKLKQDMKGPILCFVGPPGVGKTSLGKSIARALGRKFIRMSLGGVRDEAEIRGHRRTYVGALPGRIIQGIRKAESHNPLFMLDEIDKIGSDFRGDPSSALLEVLDPEQNFSFQDHYLDITFDLSKVMFITTANMLDTVPPPLRDRMEILELPGYTDEEKLHIAINHIIPKEIAEHGLKKNQIAFEDSAVLSIANSYTWEAGVRNLEREIATVCRKVARSVAEKKSYNKHITAKNISDFLGPEKHYQEIADRTATPGVATGLAWTASGGEILFIESTKMKGSQRLTLTGSLGDVMKESAQAALSYIRSRSKTFKIADELFEKNEIHIHVPAGATPKDGPSAGVAITTSLVSMLVNKPIRPYTAMTGEITLRGRVLPVGGIKEKVLAASRAGIKTVILPKRNKKDLIDLPPKIMKTLTFHFVEQIDEVLKIALKI
ncbi:MAG: endopeptidase La [Planctomycetes bacterium]|nr:endopeptidase La [Planctomycetota bacterium]